MDNSEGLDEFGREIRRTLTPPRMDNARASPGPTTNRRLGNIPYKMHDNRPVTPPPPQAPSRSYMSIASQNPCPLDPDDASFARKLLILDLNGTLLHRATGPTPVKRAPNGTAEKSVDASGRFLPRLRPVHPRPYMKAFRSYLFAPETKKWLDVMIWSSAQPHSVNDMVGKTFEDDQDQLVAIWARDTLGLSAEHYARKVQTFKDLAKPWAELPALLRSLHARIPSPSPASSSSQSSSTPMPPSSSPLMPLSSSTHVSLEPPSVHSALTTLLLDDSPRKAELQPYNHVCIPEYDGARRVKDLDALQLEKAAIEALKTESAGQAETAVEVEHVVEHISSEDGSKEEIDDSTPTTEDQSPKKRKRKDKKVKKVVALAASVAEFQARREDSYDHVLLAVIGILDEVKAQGNVAAWVRSGGLWGVSEDGDHGDGDVVISRDSTLSCSTSGSSASEDGRREGKRTKGSDELPSLRADSSGNDAISSNIPSSSTESEPAAAPDTVAAIRDGDASAPAPLWFENAGIVRRWADRGRKVLEKMGIPIMHGIER